MSNFLLFFLAFVGLCVALLYLFYLGIHGQVKMLEWL
jgi:hypothetical protein